MAWWYADKGKKIGPLANEELSQLLSAGKTNSQTLLWQEGMDTWEELRNISALKEVLASTPPEIPKVTKNRLFETTPAGRWRRWFARVLDFWSESFLVTFMAGYVLGRNFPGFVTWIREPGMNYLVTIACTPLAMLLDAAIYKLCGNTLGKALLGLRVLYIDGGRLSFRQYLARNLGVWAMGLGFGIPIVNLFTMANQAGLVSSGKRASYDEASGDQVMAPPLRWMPSILFGAFFFALLMAAGWAQTSTEQSSQPSQTTSNGSTVATNIAPTFEWENPSTHKSATLDSRWKYAVQAIPAGGQAFVFTEQSELAVVIFAAESAPGYSMGDYAPAYQKNNESTFHFSDGGRFFSSVGHEMWGGTGTFGDKATDRLHVQLVHDGDQYWRVVTIQSPPYATSDEAAGELRRSLINTLL